MDSFLSRPSVQGHTGSRLLCQYRALDRPGKEIRLLEVLPGTKDEPLRANFIRVFLSEDQTAPYETISYAWGDPTLRGEIEIDGSVLDIPASSAAALRCMRQPDNPRRLWIDAVCINQDDVPERNFQVKMMGDIYRRSSHNLVYLGEEDDSTKSALTSIERALEEMNERLGPSETLAELTIRGGPPMKCELDRLALVILFERPWFSRMWVVQEAVFAPASTCYCGAEISINLLSLIRASSYIYFFHDTIIERRLIRDHGVGNSILLSLYKCAQLHYYIDPNQGLYPHERLNEDGSAIVHILRLGVLRLCTDPRDKIFSIVGLIGQASNKTPGEGGADLALIEVDYQKCLQDVLRDATRFCIQKSRSLDVWDASLSHLNYNDENGDIHLDGFCSWVARHDLERLYQGDVPGVAMEARAGAGLSVTRETAMATTLDPNVLTLDGFAVADMIEVAQPIEADLFEDEGMLGDTLASLHQMCRGVVSPDPTTPNEFLESSACTITMSPYQPWGADRSNGVLPNLQKHFHSVCDGNLKNNESEYWSEDVRRLLVESAVDRRIFTCSNGYKGQGPRYLRAGDRIVVLLGSNVPFAVRPLPGGDGGSGERFHLLARVYVYGIMYGEFVEAAMARRGGGAQNL